jgi:hypothetical protein
VTPALIWAGLALLVILIIPPLRTIAGWIFNQIWSGFLTFTTMVAVTLQGVIKSVAADHAVVLKNLAPRGVVLPTVKKTDTVRRE